MARFTREIAERKGVDVALVDEYGETSWSDFNARVNRLISSFHASGLQAGDTIVIYSGNRREYYEVMTAASLVGLYYVPVNWHFTADELAYVARNSESRMLVVDYRFLQQAVAAVGREDGPDLHVRLLIGAPEGTMATGFDDYESFLAAGDDREPGDAVVGGPMFYTSGTTGRPKGVRITTLRAGMPMEAMEMLMGGLSLILQLPQDGRTLLAGPVYHSAQWAFSFLPLLGGSQVLSRHKFDPSESLALIDQYGITNVHLTPTQFHRLLRLPEDVRSGFSGASLQRVWHGAAPCPKDVKSRMLDWWGPIIHEYYGATEGSIVTVCSPEEYRQRPGTLGKALPMVELHVYKEDGSEAAPGEDGQIFVRNLMGSDFEYFKEPEKTAAVHKEPGLFTFGDIGHLDEDGYLFMTDRKIDMIISGGVNIYPAEIEEVLLKHPDVLDVAVFGIPNEEYGEEVKAAVQLCNSVVPGDELRGELIAHCRTHLAGYKAPRSIDFVTDFPRYPTGKLYKRLLRDRYWQTTQRNI